MSWTEEQWRALRLVVENPGAYPPDVSNADLLALEGRGLIRTRWTPAASTPPEMMHITGAVPTKKGRMEYDRIDLATFRTVSERRAALEVVGDGDAPMDDAPKLLGVPGTPRDTHGWQRWHWGIAGALSVQLWAVSANGWTASVWFEASRIYNRTGSDRDETLEHAEEWLKRLGIGIDAMGVPRGEVSGA